jgi:transcriptional regulator with XRE-family HTH domain
VPPRDVTEGDLTVGGRVAALRKIRGLSQSALGEAIGVSHQQVQKDERGVNRVGAGRLREIARFLDVPLSTLFGDECEPVEPSGDFAFLSIPGAVDLLKAFAAIENVQLRRDVLALALSAARMSAQPTVKDA